jgi:pimeloyl-ACP methyl ester carboxylesterase
VKILASLLLLFAFAAAALVQAAPPSRAPRIEPCQLPDLTESARCGTLEVPENPDKPAGRRISIGFAVVPATGGHALPDPIVVLMGGPSEDAISAAAYFALRFASLRTDRDLLLVDQRGTGRSGALTCNMFEENESADNLRDFLPLTAVQRCAAESQSRADLAQYSFARFADDLEAVRRALGYERLNLFAGSFGTRAAQVYLRAHPKSVRTVFFGSVVPLDVTIPVPMAGAFQEALERTFAACAADTACQAAFPNLRAEFQAVISRLAGGVDVKLPGVAAPSRLHSGRVAEWLRARLYRAEGGAELPWLIHRAYQGDYQPIVEGILDGARGRDTAGTAFSFGLFFCITCNEDLHFIQEAEVQRASAGTVLGDYRVRQQQAACRIWPRGKIPPGHRMPVRSDLPTLFVSGDSDPATPLWFTERVAQNFPNRAELVLAGRGHTEWTECVFDVYARFVRAGKVTGIGESGCAAPTRPPFRTG